MSSERISETIWSFGSSDGVISTSLLLDEAGLILNGPHDDAIFWLMNDQALILVNRDRAPTAALRRISDTRYEGPALLTARRWRPGMTFFLEKSELTYPLILTWSVACTEFFKRNRIYLFHGMRNDGVIAPGEKVLFLGPALVEPDTTLPHKWFVSMGAHSYVVGPMRGNFSVGRYTSIASNVQIMGDKHPMDRLSMHPLTYHHSLESVAQELGVSQEPFDAGGEPVTIGHDVWIGEGALFAKGVNIGNGAVVAARSIVTKDVPPYTVVAGSPARPVRMRFEGDLIDLLLESKWWEFNLADIPPHWSDPRRAVEELLEREADGSVQRWNPPKIDLAPSLFKASIAG